MSGRGIIIIDGCWGCTVVAIIGHEFNLLRGRRMQYHNGKTSESIAAAWHDDDAADNA